MQTRDQLAGQTKQGATFIVSWLQLAKDLGKLACLSKCLQTMHPMQGQVHESNPPKFAKILYRHSQ
jgi:hypothetical protein